MSGSGRHRVGTSGPQRSSSPTQTVVSYADHRRRFVRPFESPPNPWRTQGQDVLRQSRRGLRRCHPRPDRDVRRLTEFDPLELISHRHSMKSILALRESMRPKVSRRQLFPRIPTLDTVHVIDAQLPTLRALQDSNRDHAKLTHRAHKYTAMRTIVPYCAVYESNRKPTLEPASRASIRTS